MSDYSYDTLSDVCTSEDEEEPSQLPSQLPSQPQVVVLPSPPRLVRTVRLRPQFRPRYMGLDDLADFVSQRRWTSGNPFLSWESKVEEKRDRAEDYTNIKRVFVEFTEDLEREPRVDFDVVLNHVKFYLSHMHDGYSFLEQSFVDFTHALIRYVRRTVHDGCYAEFLDAWSLGVRAYTWQGICGRYWGTAVSEIEKLLR